MKAQNPQNNTVASGSSGFANNSQSGAVKKPGAGVFDDMIKSTDGKLAQMGAKQAKSAAELEPKAAGNFDNTLSPELIIPHFNIKPNEMVADLGSGAGNFSLPIAKLLQEGGGEVYAVDVQKDLLIKMLREAKASGLNNIKAVWGDLDKVGGSKLPDASFDTAVMINTLFQLENKQEAIKEVWRILKPLARFIVFDWITDPKQSPIGPHESQRLSSQEIIELVSDAGFMFMNEEKFGEHHAIFTFTKK